MYQRRVVVGPRAGAHISEARDLVVVESDGPANTGVLAELVLRPAAKAGAQDDDLPLPCGQRVAAQQVPTQREEALVELPAVRERSEDVQLPGIIRVRRQRRDAGLRGKVGHPADSAGRPPDS